MPITILDLAKHRGVVGLDGDGILTMGELAKVGLSLLGGCARCHASIACYNAYPTRGGYWMCEDCVGDEDGFETVEEANEAIFGAKPERIVDLCEDPRLTEAREFAESEAEPPRLALSDPEDTVYVAYHQHEWGTDFHVFEVDGELPALEIIARALGVDYEPDKEGEYFEVQVQKVRRFKSYLPCEDGCEIYKPEPGFCDRCAHRSDEGYRLMDEV